jgi:L-fucose isomerase
MRNEYVDMSELIRRLNLEIYDHDEYEKAIAWVKENCIEGEDPNTPDARRSREEKDKEWETSVKMTLIARDLMIGNPVLEEMGWGEESLGRNAIAAGFQGQRHWTDFMPNGDFMETFLNTSFDWNGIREAFVFATENDSLNGIAMLFGHLLTGTAQIFSDVRTYWSPDAVKRVTGWTPEGVAEHGFIHLINSGSTTLDAAGEMTDAEGNAVMKPYWEITEDDVARTLDATEFCVADMGYFRGGGYSTDFLSKGGMPVTMSRINLVKGLGPVMQIAEGWTAEIPEEVHELLDRRTNPTWPTTWFVPRVDGKDGPFKDVYQVMASWGANHGAVSYGHIGADLITLCSMLRIPVCMHNVAEKDIFRPSTWNAFGMDKEGSDYRACAALGPPYGRY